MVDRRLRRVVIEVMMVNRVSGVHIIKTIDNGRLKKDMRCSRIVYRKCFILCVFHIVLVFLGNIVFRLLSS